MKKLFFTVVLVLLGCVLFYLPTYAFTVIRETDFNNDIINEKAMYFGKLSAPGAGDAGMATENIYTDGSGDYTTVRVVDGAEAGVSGKVLKLYSSGNTAVDDPLSAENNITRTLNTYISAVNTGVTADNDMVVVVSYKIKTAFWTPDDPDDAAKMLTNRNSRDVLQMNFNNGTSGQLTGTDQIALQFRKNGAITTLGATYADTGASYTPGKWTWIMAIIKPQNDGSKTYDAYIDGRKIASDKATASGLTNLQVMFALNSAQEDVVYVDDFLVYSTCASEIKGLDGILISGSTVKTGNKTVLGRLITSLGEENTVEFTIRDLTVPKNKNICSVFVAEYNSDGRILCNFNHTPVAVTDYKKDVSLPFTKNLDTDKIKLFTWRGADCYPLIPARVYSTGSAEEFELVIENNFDNDTIGERAFYFGRSDGGGGSVSAGDNELFPPESDLRSIRVANGLEAGVSGKVLKFYNPGLEGLNATIAAVDTGVTPNDGNVIVVSYKIKTAYAAGATGLNIDFFQMNFNDGNQGNLTGPNQIALRFRRDGTITTHGSAIAESGGVGYTPGEWMQVMTVIRPQSSATHKYDVYINSVRVAYDKNTYSSLNNFQIMFALNSNQTDTVYIDDFSIYTAPASAF